MKDGNFVVPDGSIPKGQEIVKVLLERCLKWVDIVLDRYCTRWCLWPMILTNDDTDKEKLMSASKISMISCWKYEISLIDCQ